MRKSTYVPLTLALMVSSPAFAHGPEATELPIGDGKVTDHPKAGISASSPDRSPSLRLAFGEIL